MGPVSFTRRPREVPRLLSPGAPVAGWRQVWSVPQAPQVGAHKLKGGGNQGLSVVSASAEELPERQYGYPSYHRED